jgi:FtsP/CotA-like multicopper oxidase with cupredoxin domain
MTDWYHEGIFAMNYRALHSPFGPPLADSALLNGTMKLPDGRGTYQVTKVTQGKRFRLRLINTGVDSVFHVSIDNHNFTVISADFVPVKPYVTSSVVLNIGQRHDIILYAGQAIGNYWLRADIGTDCAANAIAGSILAIIRYDGAPETDPTTNNTITKPTSCTDEPLAIPYVNSTGQ